MFQTHLTALRRINPSSIAVQSLYSNGLQVPEQRNGCDCGVFTIKFADYVGRRAKMDWKQADMPFFRRRVTRQLLRQRVDLREP